MKIKLKVLLLQLKKIKQIGKKKYNCWIEVIFCFKFHWFGYICCAFLCNSHDYSTDDKNKTWYLLFKPEQILYLLLSLNKS